VGAQVPRQRRPPGRTRRRGSPTISTGWPARE